MLASIDRKFVLLSNPKTGTTALETAFRPYSQISIGGAPRWKHINYVKMRQMFGEFLEARGCIVYTVVRHPIEVLASWYRYRARDELSNPKHPNFKNYTGNISFTEFVLEWAADHPPPRATVGTSVEFCLMPDGEFAPITYYRYEDIGALHARLCDHIGAEPDLPRKNVSPRIQLEIDHAALSALPKMRRALDTYARVPFAPGT
jgi:hypothetical protein